MIRGWFAIGMMFSLVGVIEAQEVNPPAALKPAPRAPLFAPRVVDVDADEDGEAQFMIEFKVLEGKGIFGVEAVWSDLTPDNSTVERLLKSARLLLGKTTTAGAAPRVKDQEPSNATPVPPPAIPAAPGAALVPPTVYAYQAETTKKSAEDEFWIDVPLDNLGITTVTAPKVTLFTKQSATVQMQTSPRVSYLVPLGDGKYQAKSTVAQDLGMKITLAVLPVDGDDASVELSPLEIQITALDGREPVEGLDLEVGKPIISTRSLKTTAKMKRGATRLIAIPSGPKTQAALLVRVTRTNVRFQETTIMERKLDGIIERQNQK